MGQWIEAVTAMKGDNDAMSVADAVEIIRATSPARRSDFAGQIWARSRERGKDGPSDADCIILSSRTPFRSRPRIKTASFR